MLIKKIETSFKKVEVLFQNFVFWFWSKGQCDNFEMINVRNFDWEKKIPICRLFRKTEEKIDVGV